MTHYVFTINALRLLEHDYRGIRLGIGAENDTVSEDNL